MTLLSPLALFFGLTALVPLILHLYQRRQRTVILFSTNRFFTDSVIRSQRRLRLRRLLLLLLRMAACALLALALAKPILSLADFGRGHEGHRDLVILLDDSLSMQAGSMNSAGGASGTGAPNAYSHFDRARKAALDALDELTSGDRAAVVTLAALG